MVLLMHFIPALALVVLGITSPATSSPLEKRGPSCQEIVIPVTIDAQNAVSAHISQRFEVPSQTFPASHH